MHVVQCGLIYVILLLAISSDLFVAASKTSTTTNVTVNKEKAIINDPSSTGRALADEERTTKSSVAHVHSSLVTIGPIPSKDSENTGKTITVTKYDNNGLIQRFAKWWMDVYARFGANYKP